MRTLTSALAMLLLFGCGPAWAATVSLSADGRHLDLTESAPGEQNNLTIRVEAGAIEFFDFVGVTAGTGCVAAGGAGNDDLRGAKGADVLDGGPGDDVLNGASGHDTLRGAEGADRLTGDQYSDRGAFADVLDGGPGSDRLEDYGYSGQPAEAPAIAVSLDGVANDGRAGEGDNVLAIEKVSARSAGSFTGDDGDNEFTAPQVGAAGTLVGNGGTDVLIAGDAHGDVLDGGAGADTLEGGFGDDRLVGGPGADTLNGDRKSRCNEYACDLFVSGNDVVEARDGEVDSISCGPGADRVVADPADVVAADCESVERGSTTTTGPAPDKAKPKASVVKVRLGKALKSGLRVKLSGIKDGRVTLTAKRGHSKVASGRATGRQGRATVRLAFTKTARRSLKNARKVTLKISGAGVSAKVTLTR